MAVKWGMQTGQQDCTYRDLSRLWHLADSSGFHWLSIWDHFYENPARDHKGPSFEGLSIMAALAAETTNVRVGSLVINMGFRNPTVLAKAAITIDHISNGRLDLGVGAGYYEPEYVAYGFPYPPPGVRLGILEEGVQILRSMWTQEVTNFSGKYFQVADAYCFPKPIQQPLPLWIGGGGEQRTLRLVARYADGWNIPYASAEEYKRKLQILEQWCEAEGRDPAEIAHNVTVGFYMGVDQADARRERERQLRQYSGRVNQRPGGMLFGTASEVIERLSECLDAGVQMPVINVRPPINWDALQVFIEEVMPAFA